MPVIFSTVPLAGLEPATHGLGNHDTYLPRKLFILILYIAIYTTVSHFVPP